MFYHLLARLHTEARCYPQTGTFHQERVTMGDTTCTCEWGINSYTGWYATAKDREFVFCMDLQRRLILDGFIGGQPQNFTVDLSLFIAYYHNRTWGQDRNTV